MNKLKNNKPLKKHRGFTLVELLIVLAVIGIIAAIAVPRFTGILNGVRISADTRSAELFASAVATEYLLGELDPLVANTLTISEATPSGFGGEIAHLITNPATAMIAVITFVPADNTHTIRVFPGDVTLAPLTVQVVPGPVE